MHATIPAPTNAPPATAPALNPTSLALAALEVGVAPSNVHAFLTAPRVVPADIFLARAS